jgi:hypothetical protein
VALAPNPTLERGSHANQSSRILDSMQTVMICGRLVITLAPREDPSKQCRQDLVTSPKLYLGLLPFFDESLSRETMSKFHKDSFKNLSSNICVWARNFGKFRTVLQNQRVRTQSWVLRKCRP